MSDNEDFISRARAEGKFSDGQIASFLAEKQGKPNFVKQAMEEGYSEQEVLSFLSNEKPKAPGFVSSRASALVSSLADFGYSTLQAAADVGSKMVKANMSNAAPFGPGGIPRARPSEETLDAVGEAGIALNDAVYEFRQFASNYYTEDIPDEIKNDFSYKLVQGAGSLVAQVAAAATGVGLPAMMLSAYQYGKDDYFSSIGVPENQASDDQRREAASAAAITAIPSALMERAGAGKVLKSIMGDSAGMSVKALLKKVASTGAVEGLTEGGQTVWQNTVASKLAAYDPERELSKGVVESIIMGSLLGAAGTTFGSSINKLEAGIRSGEIKPESMASPLAPVAIGSPAMPNTSSPTISKPSTAKNIDNEFIRPMSTLLRKTSKSVFRAFRQFEQKLGTQQIRYKKIYQGWQASLKKVKRKSTDDFERITTALNNRDKKTVMEITTKYGIVEEWQKVEAGLDTIAQEAAESGVELPYLQNFYPRVVSDYDGLMSDLGVEKSTELDALFKQKEAETGNNLTLEQRQIISEQFVKGLMRNELNSSKPNHTKGRSIEKLTAKIMKRYASPESAIEEYFTSMVATIERNKFLGPLKDFSDKTAVVSSLIENKNNPKRTPSSLGEALERAQANGELEVGDIKSIQGVVKARFGEKPKALGIIQGAKDIGTIAALGSPQSTIRQIGDYAYSVMFNGPLKAIRAALSKKNVTLEDIGVSDGSVGTEFMDSGMRGVMDWIFKATGFRRLDQQAKETFLNSSFSSMQKMSLAKEGTRPYNKLLRELSEYQGEDAKKTIRDLRKGKKSPLVLEALFNRVSDIAPITMLEMPKGYANNPNGRIFYSLQSYGIKQLDLFRRTSYEKIRSGSRKEAIEGMQNLIKMGLYLTMMNAGADVLQSLFTGKKLNLTHMVWDNILRIGGLSKYQGDLVLREGPGSVIQESLSPPSLDVANSVFKDFQEGNVNPVDMETIRYFPIVGKYFYSDLGKGSKKKNRRY